MATSNDKISLGVRRSVQVNSSVRCVSRRINILELAREGLKENFPVLSNEERVESCTNNYLDGELNEGVAKVLIGDLLGDIEA